MLSIGFKIMSGISFVSALFALFGYEKASERVHSAAGWILAGLFAYLLGMG